MKEKGITKELKQFLPVVVTVLISLPLLLLFVVPKIGQIKKLNKDLTGQKKEINALTYKLTDLSSLSESELASSANLLLKALPAEKDFYTMISNVKKIFLEKEIVLGTYDFTPGEVSTASGQKQSKDLLQDNDMSLEISFVAPLTKVKEVAEKLETVLPLMKVETFKLTANEATFSAQVSDFNVEMTLLGYYSPLPQNLGKTEKSLPKLTAQKNSLIEKIKSYRILDSAESLLPVAVVEGKDNPFLRD